MGEDESFKNCTEIEFSKFPPNANEKCNDSSNPKYDIPILAIRCNGLVECKNGEDESHWYCNDIQVSKNYQAIWYFRETMICINFSLKIENKYYFVI